MRLNSTLLEWRIHSIYPSWQYYGGKLGYIILKELYCYHTIRNIYFQNKIRKIYTAQLPYHYNYSKVCHCPIGMEPSPFCQLSHSLTAVRLAPSFTGNVWVPWACQGRMPKGLVKLLNINNNNDTWVLGMPIGEVYPPCCD